MIGRSVFTGGSAKSNTNRCDNLSTLIPVLFSVSVIDWTNRVITLLRLSSLKRCVTKMVGRNSLCEGRVAYFAAVSRAQLLHHTTLCAREIFT
jgi:hypothetical protein